MNYRESEFNPNASAYNGYPYYEHVFNFEKDHNLDESLAFLERNWMMPFYITAGYVMAVYAFHKYMKKRPPVDVRRAFFIWNVVFAIFSICGTYRALPEITYVLRNFGVEFSICDNKVNSVSGFWVVAFVFSKGVELFETGFLLLRKKLNWIHLFHHVITFICTWFFSVQRPALGRWAACLNITVHAFMYTYFALKAAKVKIPEAISFCLTSLQISQFLILFLASVYALYVKAMGRHCSNSYHVAILATLIFPYFVYIFLNYFIRRYFVASPKTKKQ